MVGTGIMASSTFVVLFSTWNFLAAQDPQPPISLIDKNEPMYRLELPAYVENMNDSIISAYYMCNRDHVIRHLYGSKRNSQSDLAVAVPVLWPAALTTARRTVIVPLANFVQNIYKIWPDLIIPYLFTAMTIACAIVLIIPIMLLGGICWAIIYNLRYLANWRIRMAIRSILIKKEKVRRWYYEKCYPPQHLRKFRERDRYQLPEIFQDPDISTDDEPEELQRLHIPRQKTTMWSKQEIKMLGFDPDNIPMGHIYGDLLGTPDDLAPEVRSYVKVKKESRNEAGKASMTSGEWLQALRSRVEELKSNSSDSVLKNFWSRLQTEASAFWHSSSKSTELSLLEKKVLNEMSKDDKTKRSEKKTKKPKKGEKPPDKISRLTGKRESERSLSVKEIATTPLPPPPKFWVSRKALQFMRRSRSLLSRINPSHATRERATPKRDSSASLVLPRATYKEPTPPGSVQIKAAKESSIMSVAAAETRKPSPRYRSDAEGLSYKRSSGFTGFRGPVPASRSSTVSIDSGFRYKTSLLQDRLSTRPSTKKSLAEMNDPRASRIVVPALRPRSSEKGGAIVYTTQPPPKKNEKGGVLVYTPVPRQPSATKKE